MCTEARFNFQRGVSLIELVIFIAIVGVAVAGVLSVLTQTTRSSADPMIAKQALSIAEALLEEVRLQPFTYCDPDDATASTATSASVGVGACTSTVEAIGPEAGETRSGSGGAQFDNVNDYHGYSSAADGGIKDIGGTVIATLSNYAATVSVAATALGSVAATDALLITVTVTGPANTTVTLQGYRTRYAPNALP
ncbi:MAG: type II secretion system protein [Burkholderiaceae bacterium]|nr:MAG: type II secretion system protein [Burkholderiaceae bacterium]